MQTEQIQPATWSIRAYRPGDERALVALFERVFGRAISEAHWRWKLRQQPSPVENVWLAVDDDRPIFHYAGIPTRYRLPAGEATAMVSVDTMTAPEFQRRGLLGSVGRHVYDAWRAAGVPFVLGLPNERWGSRAGALGWQPLFSLQRLVRPLRPEAILARRLKQPALARLTPIGGLWNAIWRMRSRGDGALRVRAVDRAGPEFDQLWQRCGAGVPVSVIRDSAWVNWRYLDAPAFAYRVLLAERDRQPVGYAAYRVEQHARWPGRLYRRAVCRAWRCARAGWADRPDAGRAARRGRRQRDHAGDPRHGAVPIAAARGLSARARRVHGTNRAARPRAANGSAARPQSWEMAGGISMSI